MARGGTVDRAVVARVAFATPEDRAWLEGLLWPRVAERVAAWREEVSRADPAPRAAVVETPLLFEAGMERIFHAAIAGVGGEAGGPARGGPRGGPPGGPRGPPPPPPG